MFFECYHFPQKQRGTGHQVTVQVGGGGGTNFFGQTEISGRWVAGDPKIWAGEKN